MELLVIKLFSSNYARYPYLKAFDNLMTILFASSFIVVVVAIEIRNATESCSVKYKLIYL